MLGQMIKNVWILTFKKYVPYYFMMFQSGDLSVGVT